MVSMDDLPADLLWLHPNEAGRLAAMRFPKRRSDFLLGRWTAKQALIKYIGLSVPLSTIEIWAAPDGAPEAWISGQPAPAVISISHRAGRAFCAAAPAGTALGCDLELVEPHSDAFLTDYFTVEEQEAIREDRPTLETLYWSAKESALKALRQGLRLDTRCLNVRISGSTLAVHYAHRVFRGWWQIEDGWVRTLVADPYSL